MSNNNDDTNTGNGQEAAPASPPTPPIHRIVVEHRTDIKGDGNVHLGESKGSNVVVKIDTSSDTVRVSIESSKKDE